MSSSKDWYFSNPKQDERKKSLKKEAEQDLKNFLEQKSQQQGNNRRLKGKGSMNSTDNLDPITHQPKSFIPNQKSVRFDPNQKVETGNNNTSQPPPNTSIAPVADQAQSPLYNLNNMQSALPPVAALSPPVPQTNMIDPRLLSMPQRQYSPHSKQLQLMEDDDRYFIRRLRAAFDRENVNHKGIDSFAPGYVPVSGFYQAPAMNPYLVMRTPALYPQVPAWPATDFVSPLHAAGASGLPPIPIDSRVSAATMRYNDVYNIGHPITTVDAANLSPRDKQQAYIRDLEEQVRQKKEEERHKMELEDRMSGKSSDYNSADPPSSRMQDKRFHRGLDPSRVPDWQKEEIEKKQQQLRNNQEAVRFQMEERERERKKKLEEEREMERKELERIEKERQELDNKYQREKQLEVDAAAKKKENGRGSVNEAPTKTADIDIPITNASKTGINKNNAAPNSLSKKVAREEVQNLVLQKMMEAQKEAEELKKQKFQQKRGNAETAAAAALGSREIQPRPASYRNAIDDMPVGPGKPKLPAAPAPQNPPVKPPTVANLDDMPIGIRAPKKSPIKQSASKLPTEAPAVEAASTLPPQNDTQVTRSHTSVNKVDGKAKESESEHITESSDNDNFIKKKKKKDKSKKKKATKDKTSHRSKDHMSSTEDSDDNSQESDSSLEKIKTKKLINDLEKLKSELKKERKQLGSSRQQRRKDDNSEVDDDEDDLTRRPMDKNKKPQQSLKQRQNKIGINFNENSGINYKALSSTSYHVPIDEALDNIEWGIGPTESHPRSENTQMTIENDVMQRLADARQQREMRDPIGIQEEHEPIGTSRKNLAQSNPPLPN